VGGRGFILLSLVVGLTFSGCANIRKMSIRVSESHIKNAEATKVVICNFLAEWPLYSGMIRDYFKDDMADLPSWFPDALDALDGYSEKAKLVDMKGDCTGMEAKELGGAAGTSFRIFSKGVIEVIKAEAPELLGSLPLSLTSILGI